MALLVDTGFLYALADRSDAWHGPVVDYLSNHRQALLAPATIVPEVTYLLRKRLGSRAEIGFVRSLAHYEVAVEELKRADWSRVAEILEHHEALGFVDASVVAVAERLKVRELATTERRHFSTFKPTHAPGFILVP